MRSLNTAFFVLIIFATIAQSCGFAQQTITEPSISWLTMEEAQHASAEEMCFARPFTTTC
jgi:hypothetical protein